MKEIVRYLQENEWLIVMPLVLAIAYYMVKWKLEARQERNKLLKTRAESGDKFMDSGHEKIEFFVDTTPATPATFGRKCQWIAIASDQHKAIVNEFRKPGKKSFETNLNSGVYAAYASNIFVYPPIQGWTLVLNPVEGRSEQEQYTFVKELSKKYAEAQFFGSFRGVGYSAWMRFQDGETIRAYQVADGTVLRNEGALTEMEEGFIAQEIGNTSDPETLEWINGEGKWLCMSDEANVLKMAAAWSINPDHLDELTINALGTIIET